MTSSLLTVEGLQPQRGDIIVDHGWVIDRDFGHFDDTATW